MSAPFIPELSLGTVETGGGWGVGEKFARLPPASVQAESRLPMYTLAPERGGVHNSTDSEEDSSSQEVGSAGATITAATGPTNSTSVGKMETVPTTQYTPNTIDDDNTFVDHGSTAVASTPANDSLVNNNNNSANTLKSKKGRSPVLHPKLSRPVSRMSVGQPVRAMVVGPDAGSLLVAVGDDEVAIMDFKGVELNISRTLHVTHVYALAVVHVPAAKSVSFKSAPSTTQNNNRTSGSKSKPSTSESEESYVLWCGVARGNIAIFDLTDFTSSGVIRNAHTQTITGLWSFGNGKVWTAGYDKALKVWDPQTRRRTKSRNIATIISDLCYLRNYKQVWGISDDTLIRVFDSSGNNVRVVKQSTDKPENSLRMKSEMRFIKYYEPESVVYVALTRGLAVIDPSTCDILVNINVTLTSMAFLEDKALVTGHGELLQCTTEAIGLIDISDPLVPSLLFRGIALEGSVTSVGMRLLTALPFAVTVQETGRSERYLTVFNYEDSKQFGKGAGAAYVPQQRKVMLEGPSTRRTGVIPYHHNVVTPISPSIATTTTTTNTTNTTTAAGAGGAHVPHNSIVFATGKRPTTMREESNMSNPPQHRVAVAASSRNENNNANTNNNTNNNSNNNNNNNSHHSYKNSSNSNSANNLGYIEKGLSVQIEPPAGLMESLTSIEKKTEDLKGLFAQTRVSRLLLDDFSKLHLSVSQMAMNNELGPILDADRMASIEKEYQTLEGRVIAAAVERLRRNAASVSTSAAATTVAPVPNTIANTPGSAIPSTPTSGGIQDSERRRPSGAPPIDVERRGTSVAESNSNNNSSTRMDESSTIGGSELPPESLLRWVAQITRSGQGERESHRRQIESLQRHNTRIVERNAAFINGIARMEQALRTHAQRLLEEAETSLVMSSDSSFDSSNQHSFHRHMHLINQTIQEVEQISVSSSPKKITECIVGLISLVSRLLSMQQYIHNDGSTKRVTGEFSPDNVVLDQNNDVGRLILSNGNTEQHIGRSQSPIPTAIAVLTVQPQRTLGIIEGQLTSVEEFLKEVGRFWCCLEETQKVIYQPYEGDAKPDLFRDFMQFAVLWHLREAQVMVDVCRNEAILVMAETLLSDLESQENTVESGLGGSLRGVNAGISAGGVGGTTTNTTMGSANLAETIRNDSARLVGLGIELESIASRMRESLKKSSRSLPEGIPKETVGGFFLIPSEKLHVDDTKLRGMLHWERVTMHLIFECLECLEGLLFHSDEQPRPFRKDNFKALEQQMDDWSLFLEDVLSETTQLRSVILSSHRTSSAVRAGSSSMPQSSHHHHHHHHHNNNNHTDHNNFNRTTSSAATTTNTNSQLRQSTGSGSYGPLPSTDTVRSSDAVDVPCGTPWVVLFGLFMHIAARPRPPALPSLFAAPDAGDFGLMAPFDDVAEAAETVRAKSTALLLYCRKLQSRLGRVVEEAVVQEETGLVYIPAWRGGTIAERYCKGFCHDLC
ncbi:uncharacterized protein TM35_000301940 [Trypanosoma theileri]|uniref:Uncharacterized protein n=1 Tax=Trypanosoma theileri TaxID=67003 RepID=A0A1X0NN69_9TRYP|nr:uncharacterized protein TM35_000301940 [Trypanosoma theileri]ORC86154.1 hypothetical protein TM35_000301940 [Trypanosoma theileri]